MIVLVAVAGALALWRSSWLIDYAIWMLALNRGLRRLVDYYLNGHFNPFSPVSLVPLAIGGLLFVTAFHNFKSLPTRPRKIIMLLLGALFFAFLVGIIHNGVGAIYSLGEWIAGVGAMLFAATHPAGGSAGNRWLKTAGWAGVFVAAYGWWQYYTIPPWDAMWLVESGMSGYMGLPEPTEMTCFSTMSERGPCAAFLGWAIIPMILSARWRNLGGWFSVLLILSAMFLTAVRSMFVVVGLVAILYPLLARGRSLGGTLLLAIFLGFAANYGIGLVPGAERFSERFQTQSLIGEGTSLTGRMEIYQSSLQAVVMNPLGFGLGSSGMARRATGGSAAGVGDAGYLQILAQFGWLGTAMFFSALALLWKEASQRASLAQRSLPASAIDPFPLAARSVLLAMLVLLFISDIFAGFSLVWVIFGRAINPWTHPVLTIRLMGAAAEKEVPTLASEPA